VESAKERTRLNRLISGVTTIFARVNIKSPAEFYRHFYSQIYRFVFIQTGAPHDDVEDIVQDALLAAWRAREGYEGESELETWITAIVKHKIADHWRIRARLDRRNQNAVREALKRAETLQIPDELLDTVEMREFVDAALSKLDPQYARVLALRYLQDLPVRAIARQLDESEAAIESRLSRARDAFRGLIRGGSSD
jgi:RNA polymerase sigma-70 factor (ECF subfamily)